MGDHARVDINKHIHIDRCTNICINLYFRMNICINSDWGPRRSRSRRPRSPRSPPDNNNNTNNNNNNNNNNDDIIFIIINNNSNNNSNNNDTT